MLYVLIIYHPHYTLKKNFVKIADLVEWVLKVRGWIRFSGSGPVLVPVNIGMAGGALFEL